MTPGSPTIPAFLKPLSAFNAWTSLLAIRFAGALLALMVLMILSQVFFRYVLNDSLPWTEEMAKFAMVWIAFMVAPWVYRQDLNVAIHMFADAFPTALRKISELIITLLVIVICVIFLDESITFTLGGLGIQASSVPVKLAYFYACGPISFTLLCTVGLERAILQIMGLFSGRTPTDGVNP